MTLRPSQTICLNLDMTHSTLRMPRVRLCLFDGQNWPGVMLISHFPTPGRDQENPILLDFPDLEVEKRETDMLGIGSTQAEQGGIKGL